MLNSDQKEKLTAAFKELNKDRLQSEKLLDEFIKNIETVSYSLLTDKAKEFITKYPDNYRILTCIPRHLIVEYSFDWEFFYGLNTNRKVECLKIPNIIDNKEIEIPKDKLNDLVKGGKKLSKVRQIYTQQLNSFIKLLDEKDINITLIKQNCPTLYNKYLSL